MDKGTGGKVNAGSSSNAVEDPKSAEGSDPDNAAGTAPGTGDGGGSSLLMELRQRENHQDPQQNSFKRVRSNARKTMEQGQSMSVGPNPNLLRGLGQCERENSRLANQNIREKLRPRKASKATGEPIVEVRAGPSTRRTSKLRSRERSLTLAPHPVGDACSGNLHPLLFEEILENVFRHLINQPSIQDAARDVISARQTCSTWKDVVTRLYRRTRPALKFLSHDSLWNMNRFLQTMKQSEMVPVQSYKMVANSFSQESLKTLKEFLVLCGPEAVSIDLHFKRMDLFSENFNLSSLKEKFDLMKLTALKLQIDYIPPPSDFKEGKPFENFIGVLLSAAKKLVQLKLDLHLDFPLDDDDDEPLHPETIRIQKRALERMVCHRIPSTVKLLHLQMYLSEITFNYLRGAGIKLEELGFFPDCVAGGNVREFLESQADNLKVLRILTSANHSSSTIREIPQLRNLKYLELPGMVAANFSFAETFPKLECLSNVGWKSESTYLDFLKYARTSSTLKTLRLPLSQSFPMEALVKEVANYFPTITELWISSELMANVFRYFPNIEALHVHFPSQFLKLSFDLLFSRLPKINYERICKHGQFDGINLAGMQLQPSILNLTRLKRVVMTSSPSAVKFDPVLILTDFSVHVLLLKMAELVELSLFGFRLISEISPGYMDLLNAKLKLKVEKNVHEEFDYSSSNEELIDSDEDRDDNYECSTDESDDSSESSDSSSSDSVDD